MRVTPLSCALLAAVVLACKSETAPASSTTSAPAMSTSSTRAPATPSAYKDEDLPVPPDFEAEAAKAITADNYKQKLAEIVAEITGAEGSAAASASANAKVKSKGK